MHKTSTSFHFEEFYYSVRGQFFVLLDKIVSEQWEYTGMNIQEFFVEWPIFDFCLSKIGTIKQNKNRSWRENLSVGIDMPKLGVFENVIVVIKFFLEVVELAPVTRLSEPKKYQVNIHLGPLTLIGDIEKLIYEFQCKSGFCFRDLLVRVKQKRLQIVFLLKMNMSRRIHPCFRIQFRGIVLIDKSYSTNLTRQIRCTGR